MLKKDFPDVIDDIVKYRPDLTANGLNSQSILTSENMLFFSKMLKTHEKEFCVCVNSLTYLCSLKPKQYYSYALKHVIEKENHTYIANGTLIAAAIYLGLRLKTYRGFKNSPNTYILTHKLEEIYEVQNA